MSVAASTSMPPLTEANEEDRFFFTVMKQNNLLSAKRESMLETFLRVDKNSLGIHVLNLKDMNLSAQKISKLAQFFPRVWKVDVARSYLDGALICSRDVIARHFPAPSKLKVNGVEQNMKVFFELQHLPMDLCS